MIDFIKMFFLGLVWIFLINANTRILASRKDFLLPAGWSLIVSAGYLFFIRMIAFTDDWIALMGYPLGGAIATGIVVKFIPLTQKRKEDV